MVINAMGGATLGAFRSTPLGIVMIELTPARVLFDMLATRNNSWQGQQERSSADQIPSFVGGARDPRDSVERQE